MVQLLFSSLSLSLSLSQVFQPPLMENPDLFPSMVNVIHYILLCVVIPILL